MFFITKEKFKMHKLINLKWCVWMTVVEGVVMD